MRRSTAFLTSLLAGSLCTACSWHSSVRVTAPGVHDVGEGAAHIRTGEPVSVGNMSLCLSRAGRATIDDVSLVGPVGGIKVDGWTLVNHPKQATEMFIGTDRQTLRSYRYPLTHTVDMPCARDEQVQSVDELVVQVERTDDRDAGSHAFRIDWTSNDDHGSLIFPLGIALCQESSADAPACLDLNVY